MEAEELGAASLTPGGLATVLTAQSLSRPSLCRTVRRSDPALWDKHGPWILVTNKEGSWERSKKLIEEKAGVLPQHTRRRPELLVATKRCADHREELPSRGGQSGFRA